MQRVQSSGDLIVYCLWFDKSLASRSEDDCGAVRFKDDDDYASLNALFLSRVTLPEMKTFFFF
jgi:hypothetical protein